MKKLNLNKISIRSFTTTVEESSQIKGGAHGTEGCSDGCTWICASVNICPESCCGSCFCSMGCDTDI